MDGDPLYPADVVRQWDERLDLLTVIEVDDCNHYTIMFDPRCAAVVASSLRGDHAETEETP